MFFIKARLKHHTLFTYRLLVSPRSVNTVRITVTYCTSICTHYSDVLYVYMHALQ